MRRLLSWLLATGFTLGLVPSAEAQAPTLSADQREAREIFQELININTSASVGSTAKAAEAMVVRLRKAGFADQDITIIGETPKLTNLIVRLRGAASAKKPILLMAHLDVVEAKREDWSTDPYTFVERDGYYYGRGTSDNKDGVAVLMSVLLRYRREGFVPDRDIIAVFTSDEETAELSIQWLVKQHRPLVDAEYALNTDGGGGAIVNGKHVAFSVQASEKVYLSFWLDVTNRGGHSSVPRADNAIYQLAAGLTRFAKYTFPVRLNEVSRKFFERAAAGERPEVAAAMRRIAANPNDVAAAAKLSAASPLYNSLLRTTCVATRLEGGHADNALPQLARAMVNCRMAPTDPPDSVQATIRRVLADTNIKMSRAAEPTASPPSPLTPAIMGPIEKLVKETWPGAVVVPEMSTGATDGLYTRNVGIPTYGVSAVFGDINDIRAHGRDERVMAQSFHEAAEFWYKMVKTFTRQATP